MNELWLYDFLSKPRWMNYRAKIMSVAFAGTHIPLIVLVTFFALKSSPDWRTALITIGVALGATLAGTGLTLFILNHLLRPVLMTSRTLSAYRRTRDVGALPTHYTDEVGALMAGTSQTLVQLEAALDSLEFVDPATGVPNRKRLERDLESRIAAGSPFVVCAIQFGGYRPLTEAVELALAESAAAEMARRLRNAFVNDRLYRVTGENFIAVRTADAAAEPPQIAEQLRADLAGCRQSIAVAGLEITPALLAGVSAFPADGDVAAQLIDHALAAVALAAGDLQISFHSPQARSAAYARLKLRQDLRRALDNDEFLLHYQPLIDLERGRPVGAEALIRWRHPEHGLLPPGRFIGDAESSGLIEAIGLWVMRRTCRQIRDWNAAGLVDLKVAVNLSARQFLDPNLTRFVEEALTGSGVSPAQLEIELTETAATADEAYTRRAFGALRELGVSIALDDFGTGYASMSQLRRLPFDKLKIDREFVSNVQDRRDSQAICEALIALGDGMGLQVLAEGAETEAEVLFLKARGCNLFQGYYFARPLEADRLPGQMAALTRSATTLNTRRIPEALASAVPAQ